MLAAPYADPRRQSHLLPKRRQTLHLERLLSATVVPGECEGAFASLVNSYIADFLPQTPTEPRAVESMTDKDWRISRFETALNDGLIKVITADTSADAANVKIATAVY